MRRQLLPAVRILLVFTVLLGLAYPLAVTGVAQVLFPHEADGSLVHQHGRVVGSELLGQSFTKRQGGKAVPDLSYFQPRPSAAGNGYDGTASSASNYGPTNPVFLKLVEQRVAQYRSDYRLASDTKVPVDAVTASASGLDPDVSIANARLQAPTVARHRHRALAQVLRLIDDHVDGRSLGFLGERGVNVLDLNVALDKTR